MKPSEASLQDLSFLADVCDVHGAGKGHSSGQAHVVSWANVSGLPHRFEPCS